MPLKASVDLPLAPRFRSCPPRAPPGAHPRKPSGPVRIRSAAFTFRFTSSSVSPNTCRRSEWPMRMYRAPASFTMAGDISPVNAPSFSKYMFWTPTSIGSPAEFGHFAQRAPPAGTPPLRGSRYFPARREGPSPGQRFAPRGVHLPVPGEYLSSFHFPLPSISDYISSQNDSPSLDGRGKGRVEACNWKNHHYHHPHPASPIKGEEKGYRLLCLCGIKIFTSRCTSPGPPRASNSPTRCRTTPAPSPGCRPGPW